MSVNSLGMRLAAVPAGTFQMGGADPRGGFDWNKDERRHTVRISRGFRIGVAPVTNAEFRRFDPTHRSGDYRGVDLDGDDHPVVRVSWHQAVAFCEWLSAQPAERRAGRRYRLPTEAEWEYAARAGTDTAFLWGDDFRADRCNFADRRAAGLRLAWADTAADDGHAATSPAGAYPANRWGLHDMAGNVWQWTADRYGHDYPAGPVTDPTGPTRGATRVLRGGSWYARPQLCRSAARIAFDPDQRRPYFGFRIVCETE